MKKKDTLYTVTPWNKRMVASRAGSDRKENLFWDGGIWGQLATKGLDLSKHSDAELDNLTDLYKESKNAFGISKQANPLSKGNIKNTANIALNVGAQALSPFISGGYESKAGSLMKTASKVASAIPGGDKIAPFLELGGAAFDRFIGQKVDTEALREANEGTAYLNNFRSNAKSFDGIKGPQTVAAVRNVYKDGLLGGNAGDMNAALRRQRQDALSWAGRSVENNIDNIASDQMNNALANYAAEGGFMDFAGGMDVDSAIGYGFMNDYLLNKKAQNESKNKVGGLGFLGGEPQGAGTLLALGGDVQTHGGDFTTGMTRVDAGGSHEGNPNDGVQMGVDGEGVPNLVEEGEVVFNDFVYSRRIMVDDEVKKRFHLPKKKEMSYADVAKKLEKEFAERPNDPISKSAFKKQMEELAQMQEEQKKEMEVERARQAFEALSDEEKMALIQQQEAQEQAALQQQAMAEQQMAQAGGLQEFACGGKIKHGLGGNLFAGGGALEWLEKNYPNHGNKEEVARWMTAYSKKHIPAYRAGKAGVSQKIDASEWRDIYSMIRGTNSWSPTLSSLYEATGIKWDLRTEKGRKEHFDMLVRNGMDRKVAFGFAYPQGTSKSTKEYNANREKAYNELVKNYKGPKANTPEVTTTKNNPNNTTETRVVQQGSQATIRNANAANKAFREGIDQGLASINTQPVALAAPVTTSSGSSQAASAYTPASVYQGIEGINPYDWYRNGSDGYSTPTGFTVGNNGLIRPEDYTQEYRDLVSRLGADDIRKWAAEHPNDPSLLSFLARGNRLEDLTDDQWRRGATDGKYGFMHHVADQILQGQNNNAAQAAVTEEPVDAGMSDRQRYYPQASDFHGEDGTNKLYGLSLMSPTVGPEVAVTPEGTPASPSGEADTRMARPKTALEDPSLAPPAPEINEPAVVKNPEEIEPKHKWEALRYAGLFGPAFGLGLNLAGVGRPKFAGLDAAFSIANNPPVLANWKPIGNYVPYKPFDVWSQRNRNAANLNSAIRAITNTSNPNKNAGVVAALHNALNADGELGIAADKYNYANLLQSEGFNRDTDKYDSQAYQQNSQFNADALNRNRQYAASLAMNAEAQKMAADAGWYNSIYGNIAGFTKGLGELGRENKEYNMFVDLLGTGAIPGIDPKRLINAGLYKRKQGAPKYSISNKNGGKIGRKKGRRGLTF